MREGQADIAFVLTTTQLPRSLLLQNTYTTMAKQQPPALRVLLLPRPRTLAVLPTRRPHVDWVLLCPRRCFSSNNTLFNKPSKRKRKPLVHHQALIVSTQPACRLPICPSLLYGGSTLLLLPRSPHNPDLLLQDRSPRLLPPARLCLLLARLLPLRPPRLANNPHYHRDSPRDRTRIPT